MAEVPGRKKLDFSLRHESVSSKEIQLSFQYGWGQSTGEERNLDETRQVNKGQIMKDLACHAQELKTCFIWSCINRTISWQNNSGIIIDGDMGEKKGQIRTHVPKFNIVKAYLVEGSVKLCSGPPTTTNLTETCLLVILAPNQGGL